MGISHAVSGESCQKSLERKMTPTGHEAMHTPAIEVARHIGRARRRRRRTGLP